MIFFVVLQTNEDALQVGDAPVVGAADTVALLKSLGADCVSQLLVVLGDEWRVTDLFLMLQGSAFFSCQTTHQRFALQQKSGDPALTLFRSGARRFCDKAYENAFPC